MAVSDDYLRYVLDQLAGLGHVTPRRMFGAVGLYHEERFFAIISRDTLYFKVNDCNRSGFEKRGMQRFRPFDDKPLWSMTYYTVPADVLEDAEECVIWARESAATATIARKPASRRTTKKRKRRTPASRSSRKTE